MSQLKKMIVCGVGGQGVTFTVRLLMQAAVLANVEVNTDEIHGLSQRGGVVNAGLTFGTAGHGYVDEGEADFLIGLEKLEVQRCIGFLKSESQVVIDNIEIIPYTVNAGTSEYPDTKQFISQLEKVIEDVKFIDNIDHISKNFRRYYILGVVSKLKEFPIDCQFIEQAIRSTARAETVDESVKLFYLGREY